MILLNFSHPLTEEHLQRITELVGAPHERLIEVKVQFDTDADFIPQVAALVDGLDLTPQDWQNKPFVVVLPSLNYIAAILLAELHGLMGHFPTILRLRPVRGALITTYEVAEIVNLEEVRQNARNRR